MSRNGRFISVDNGEGAGCLLDQATGSFTNWSVPPERGAESNAVAVSNDGSALLEWADSHGYLVDPGTGTTSLVDSVSGSASALAMTPNASAVAFGSTASDLVQQDTNGVSDVFLRSMR